MAPSTESCGLTAGLSAEAEAGAATAALPPPLPLSRAEAPPRNPDERGRVSAPTRLRPW
jgi:hypothetical protein